MGAIVVSIVVSTIAIVAVVYYSIKEHLDNRPR